MRKIDGYCPDGAIGGAKTAFFAEVGGNGGSVVLDGYCPRGANIGAAPAGGAFFFINDRYHQITIPRRYPS